MQKTLIAGASSGLVAGMLFMGSANSVLADGTDISKPVYFQESTTGMHMMHRWNSATKINALATHLGLDPAEVSQEIKSGKALKQILQDHGIVPGQLQKAFENKKSQSKRIWKKTSQSL